MRIKWDLYKKILITSSIVFIIITQCHTVAAQDETDYTLLSEISHDWSTDMIIIYIETPNRWDPTYGIDYNITSLNILNEISAVEEALDPQKDDLGDEDEIFFVHSISVLIKEIFISQRNIAMAVSEEFEIPIPTEQIPGGYAIPQDQDEIDEIVAQIPQETWELFVRDTNGDGVWDTAVIWLAVTTHSGRIEGRINNLIDRYYIDLNVPEDDYNSRESWWERIIDTEIHCAMTSLGYTTSYETYHGPAQALDALLPFVTVIILLILTLILIVLYQSKRDRLQKKGKNSLKIGLILMIILIAVCSPFVFIDTSLSPSPKLMQYSDELGGGQMGMVLIRGNPAPGDEDQHTSGRGSMKDIEVLDDMDEMQEQLRGVVGISPYCIIDIMKTIRIIENAFPDMIAQMPDPIRNRLNQTINLSFWDAIHNASDEQTSPWYWYYGKTQQESFINIFYNSITIEMRSTFVNDDYSRSLMYIQMPMEDPEDSSTMIRAINNVIHAFPVGQSTSNIVIIGEYSLLFRFLAWTVEVLFLFVIMVVGVVVFAVYFHKIRNEGKGGDEDVQPFIPDYEIGLKENF